MEPWEEEEEEEECFRLCKQEMLLITLSLSREQ